MYQRLWIMHWDMLKVISKEIFFLLSNMKPKNIIKIKIDSVYHSHNLQSRWNPPNLLVVSRSRYYNTRHGMSGARANFTQCHILLGVYTTKRRRLRLLICNSEALNSGGSNLLKAELSFFYLLIHFLRKSFTLKCENYCNNFHLKFRIK